MSTAQTQTDFSEDEADDFTNTLLNSSDENYVLDMDRASLRSLEDISAGDLIRNRKLSSKRQKSLLNRKTSSLKSSSTGSASPLDSPAECSTASAYPSNSLDRLLTRSDSSSNPLERPSTENAFTDPLEGPSTRTVYFSNSAEDSVISVCQVPCSETVRNENPNEQNWLGYWRREGARWESFLIPLTRQIRNSVYFPLFQVALLAIPYSAGYMGLKYLNLCRGCPRLSVLTFVNALFGILIMIMRIAAALSRRYFAPHLNGLELHHPVTALSITYFLFHAFAVAITVTCEPNFIDPGSKEFCIKVFYDYTLIVNIVLPLVILLMCLINVPAWFDESETEDFNF
ncbi:uncharacterized protein LOC129957381 isoform X2 [Argiope bruennichi]|nr:uncharacterized protein LOC129957381 isoform X2 [Argiope bruennichi]XP_055925650.1 uncharacterized protein LOC129957381 isoform X2 [Argiope bruennichi]